MLGISETFPAMNFKTNRGRQAGPPAGKEKKNKQAPLAQFKFQTITPTANLARAAKPKPGKQNRQIRSEDLFSCVARVCCTCDRGIRYA